MWIYVVFMEWYPQVFLIYLLVFQSLTKVIKQYGKLLCVKIFSKYS